MLYLLIQILKITRKCYLKTLQPRCRNGISNSATAPRFIRFLLTLHEILNKEITEIYEKNQSNIEARD